uniref:Uncharacterized protein n=1 Tax=Solanum lycopersicum TaxID=4081 RepID=A0A3Q7EX43_SOLLC
MRVSFSMHITVYLQLQKLLLSPTLFQPSIVTLRICSYLYQNLSKGSAIDLFATANIAVGYFLIMYVVTPLMYWFNVYKARNSPIFSDEKYDHEGRLYLSIVLLLTYGFSFACLTATVVHVFLFHGWDLWHLSKSALQEKKMDVHTKLMRKYKQVPKWWFMIILRINIIATVFVCEYYKNQLQLPWWGVLLACCLAFFFTLPIGVIAVTTNQTPGLNVITEYIILSTSSKMERQ